jgi:CHAD domain-containing protein
MTVDEEKNPDTDEKSEKALKDYVTPVVPTDAMSEAGRKVFLTEFINMLDVEVGSRTGEDIEDVHKMRVAIRRMRSAFRLLDAYYKPKAIQPFLNQLRRLMRALGAVRDLDVLIQNLVAFQTTLDETEAAQMQEVIDALDQRRVVARKNLVRVLDSKNYRRFIKDFTKFLITPGAGAKPVDPSGVVPYQVRHVLARMIYEHLLAVRAYETVLETADSETLHSLRIEFKRLRYTVSLFDGILGSKIEDFIDELKTVQDFLGRLNDINVAHDRLNKLMEDLEGEQITVLWTYINHLDAEKPALLEKMPGIWKHFNSKPVQRKLAAAIIDL